MTTTAEWRLGDRPATFSFYLTAHACKKNPAAAILAAEMADAITIADAKGPEVAKRLRDAGLEAPILFDGMGYKEEVELRPEVWARQQVEAGAAHILLPGEFIPWDRDSDAVLTDIVREQGHIAADLDAMMLIATDIRWVAKRTQLVVDALRSTSQNVALVLAHRADPLSVAGAVPGLRRVASKIDGLFQLRGDHGAIGSAAFGAEHASIGLMTSTRHYATAAMRPRRRPGSSARLFVRPLLDWFLASDAAGWTAAGGNVDCSLPCCGGNSLSRFLDPDLDARWHNMNALADFASYVLNAAPSDQPTVFVEACRGAASQYGLAGFQGPESPKSQLTSWALS
ncbi:hypothetical protein [Candidatus Poriferisocius sp.]|uniref:hypothetical protein n=1 Tax=Candidatus Poriferisocius sp. TaxID=3101276 RepID=UPI003B010BC2